MTVMLDSNFRQILCDQLLNILEVNCERVLPFKEVRNNKYVKRLIERQFLEELSN